MSENIAEALAASNCAGVYIVALVPPDECLLAFRVGFGSRLAGIFCGSIIGVGRNRPTPCPHQSPYKLPSELTAHSIVPGGILKEATFQTSLPTQWRIYAWITDRLLRQARRRTEENHQYQARCATHDALLSGPGSDADLRLRSLACALLRRELASVTGAATTCSDRESSPQNLAQNRSWTQSSDSKSRLTPPSDRLLADTENISLGIEPQIEVAVPIGPGRRRLVDLSSQ